MGAPQIVMIVLFTISLTSSIFEDQKQPKGSRTNFISTFLATIVQVLILAWGGFWG